MKWNYETIKRRYIEFEPVLNGIVRKATPKEKVNGYKHTESNGIHFYTRGKIAFIVDTNHGCTLEKFDYSKHKYLPVIYNDFHRFIDIKVIN